MQKGGSFRCLVPFCEDVEKLTHIPHNLPSLDFGKASAIRLLPDVDGTRDEAAIRAVCTGFEWLAE